MRKNNLSTLLILAVSTALVFNACNKDLDPAVRMPPPPPNGQDNNNVVDNTPVDAIDPNDPPPGTYPAVTAMFGDRLNLNALENYANQQRPGYINKDNAGNNPITNRGATLGRVLFYDKKLSINNTISCASCHKQANAFGDNVIASTGVNGQTDRHAMRLVNARFSQETRFFWDERAASLELQTTQPIQNHAEMGYSGQNGDPGIAELLVKLQAQDYYRELFTVTYGNEQVTEARLQTALSQFIRSIQSFDAKFDAGMAQVNNLNADFPNFTAQENSGKRLYLAPPPAGAGCQGCHRGPEFDIAPNSRNNGIVGIIGNTAAIDVNNTRAPSLRNLLNIASIPNGQFMHNGSISTLAGVIDHYNNIPNVAGNNNLDNRLRPNGQPQNLNLSQTEKDAIVAFLATLSGNDVYTNTKWSDPF